MGGWYRPALWVEHNGAYLGDLAGENFEKMRQRWGASSQAEGDAGRGSLVKSHPWSYDIRMPALTVRANSQENRAPKKTNPIKTNHFQS